jgi:hypothetical protein
MSRRTTWSDVWRDLKLDRRRGGKVVRGYSRLITSVNHGMVWLWANRWALGSKDLCGTAIIERLRGQGLDSVRVVVVTARTPGGIGRQLEARESTDFLVGGSTVSNRHESRALYHAELNRLIRRIDRLCAGSTIDADMARARGVDNETMVTHLALRE